MRVGSLLIGGAVAATELVGVVLLSTAANRAGSSLGALVGCVPTLPPDDKDDESDSDEQSSQTWLTDKRAESLIASLPTRPEINFWVNSPSPSKWTESLC